MWYFCGRIFSNKHAYFAHKVVKDLTDEMVKMGATIAPKLTGLICNAWISS
jgi:hypothetical protein